MNIIIHRGTHQIGGCATEFNVNGERILVDLGANLPGTDEMAAISDDALCGKLFTEEKDPIGAVLYTHYHGDHCGLYHKIPEGTKQYIGELARDIMYTVNTYTDKNNLSRIKAMKTYNTRSLIKLENFTIQPFYTDHSALDAYMFLIKTEGKTILFTGDFREHGIVGENDRFGRVIDKYIPKNIDLLITEGTMISRMEEVRENDVHTEADLGRKAFEIFSKHQCNFVLVSSTNMDSIMEFYHNTPKEYKFICDYYQAKLIALAMKGMQKKGNFELYRPHAPIYVIDLNSRRLKSLNILMKDAKHPVKWMSAENIKYREDKFVMLARKNNYPENGPNRFEEIRNELSKDDVYITYSMWKGYLSGDKADKSVQDFIDGYSWELLHTSGHAYVETIADLIFMVNPKQIIPMHSENPEGFCELPALRNYRDRIVILDDGEVFEL